MLSQLWDEAPVPLYLSRWILAEPAREAWQLRDYFALRQAVFVSEQGMFEASDRDAFDARALPLVAMATSAGVCDEVVGVVRIYEQTPGVWYGGRLAVTPCYRRCREVGSALTHAAVGAARGLGAQRFLATVQADNVAFFERLQFRALEPLTLCGRLHWMMEAELSAFAVPAWVAASTRSAA
jgi:putative N-acetyltransferase (TIGR04045 family)